MSYESIAAVSQIVAMVLFGSVILGVVVHVLRPANRAHFEAAARLPLDHDTHDGTGEQSHGQ